MCHYSTARVSDYKQAGISWSYMLIHIGGTNFYIVEKMGNLAYQYINSMLPLKIWIQFTETQVQLAVINSEQTDTYNQQTMLEKSLLREILCFGPGVPISDTLLHFPCHKTNLCQGKLLVYVNMCCANKTDGHYKFITTIFSVNSFSWMFIWVQLLLLSHHIRTTPPECCLAGLNERECFLPLCSSSSSL